MRDLVIVGSGPAGLSAAVYAKRAGMDVVVLEKAGISGGQILTTEQVDNYLGLPGIGGYDMSVKFREHAEAFGVEFMDVEVTNIQRQPENFLLTLDQEELTAKAVIVATGATHRMLGVPGEKELAGAGVSYCATCDGAFFQGKEAAVVGGGDVALEDALYLSKLCKKVTLIHRREEFRGAKMLGEQVLGTENIEFLPFYEVKEIRGDKKVTEVLLLQNQDGSERKISVDAVFIAVGTQPVTQWLEGIPELEKDAAGFLAAGEDCRTSEPGLYAVGDVRTKEVRQIVTAVADGAYAIASIQKDWGK